MTSPRPLRPTALVTGANRGLGLAIAEGLIAKGCAVTLGARNQKQGQAAAARIGASFLRLDLQEADSYCDGLIAAGGFDILVNNAGTLKDASLLTSASDFTEAMEVMVMAPLDLIRLCVPRWERTGWGRVVNISSDWGSHAEGLGGPGGYGVAKAALNALTRTLPRDLPPGVKINACCPGWLRTRMGGEGATRSTAEGADTPVWLATLPEDGPTGGFFRDRQPLGW
jgi:NAD(P)-dependent dehydrogenase (short-subunit alcohol dehydrogenase family)